MRQLFGYILAVIGVIVVLLSYPVVQKALSISLANQVSNNIILIIGIVIVAVAAFVLFQGSSGKVAEVPIYHGKQIVGYRRVQN